MQSTNKFFTKNNFLIYRKNDYFDNFWEKRDFSTKNVYKIYIFQNFQKSGVYVMDVGAVYTHTEFQHSQFIFDAQITKKTTEKWQKMEIFKFNFWPF